MGGKPFSDAIVANWAAIDSSDVIFDCCGNDARNKSATHDDLLTLFGGVKITSGSEQSLESLSDSKIVYFVNGKK